MIKTPGSPHREYSWESIILLLNNVLAAVFCQFKNIARMPLLTLFTDCVLKAIFLPASFPFSFPLVYREAGGLAVT
jgi:hypothetical protein